MYVCIVSQSGNGYSCEFSTRAVALCCRILYKLDIDPDWYVIARASICFVV